jgi:hypothetical protein
MGEDSDTSEVDRDKIPSRIRVYIFRITHTTETSKVVELKTSYFKIK